MKHEERQWQPVRLGGEIAAPAGAYSPGIRAGGFIFVSGQIPKDPDTSRIVGDDIETQTRQVLVNVRAVLESAGASLKDLVSVTVYLADPDLWGRFNEEYKSILSPPYPTRTAVGASLRGILVEISAVAYVGNADPGPA